MRRIHSAVTAVALLAMGAGLALAGKQQAERVAYATSADVTGDKSRVVGYAGMLFE